MFALPRALSFPLLLLAACSFESAEEPNPDIASGQSRAGTKAEHPQSSEVRARYRVQEIPPPVGFLTVVPESINATGSIAGSLNGRANTTFIHRAGVTRAFDVFGQVSGVSGINALGDIVGTGMQPGKLDTFKPFQWLNGATVPIDLMTLLPNVAVTGAGSDINAAQVVVGTFEIQAEGLKPHPFVYHNATGELTVLYPPNSTYAYGTAVNAANQVVGHSWGGTGEGFVYDIASGEYSSLAFVPEAISDAGLIVGNRDGATPIVKQLGESEVPLPTFGTPLCRALAVNNSGVIVGIAALPAASDEEEIVGVSFEAGSIVNLNQRLIFGEPWHLVAARDINESGVIVGLARRTDDVSRRLRGVRLTPTSAE